MDLIDTIKYHNKMMGFQDNCLIAISEGKSPPSTALRSLPPWRAVLIARIALNAGVFTDQDLHELVEEAKLVGGSGKLRRLP